MKRALSAVETTAALFLLAIALLTATNVTMRAFGRQLPDWFDLSRMLLGIAMFWGMSIATYRAGHIAVDIVWEHLNAANRRRLDIVAGAISLVFLLPLAWMVWVKVAGTGTQATSDLRWPLAPFYAFAALGAVAAAVLGLVRLVQLARGRAIEDEAAPLHVD